MPLSPTPAIAGDTPILSRSARTGNPAARRLAARIAALAIASAMIEGASEALAALADHQVEIALPVTAARQDADRALSRVNALIAAALPDGGDA